MKPECVTEISMDDLQALGLHLAPNEDWQSLLGARKWLESALVGKGAIVTGMGCGMGQADLDVIVAGQVFNVSIRSQGICSPLQKCSS